MRFRLTKSMALDGLMDAIKHVCESNPLGVEVTLDPIKVDKTVQQNAALWLLYSEWLRQRPMTGVTPEDLHQWVCCHQFGRIEREYPDGRIDWIPLRTTTKVWDHDAKRYRRKKLSREDESALIEAVYRYAAEGGVVLPEIERRAA